MTSIGRGRAWARPSERESALRRPGRASSPKSSQVEDLINRIYNDIRLDDPTPVDALAALGAFGDSLQEGHTVESLVEKLWKQALDDRYFGIKLMMLMNKPENRDGVQTEANFLLSWRAGLLRKLQDCYERREELRKENHLHLSNLVWILGAVIKTTTPKAKGRYILTRVLATALIRCLILLLETATEEDTETVAIQVCVTGKIINSVENAPFKEVTDNPSFSEVIKSARTILVNRNVSARTRALLLLIIDFANHQCEPLTGDLQAFYVSVLARGENHEAETGREFNSESYLYGLLTKDAKPEKNENHSVTKPSQEITQNKLPLQQTQKMNRGPGAGGSGPTPRAIRGSGASESLKEHRNDKRSPRGHKDKLTDEQVWSAKQNTGSKVWGHDDRFDNDYE